MEIAPFAGDRSQLDGLFALADDSLPSVASYRDLGTLLVARDGEVLVGMALVVRHDAARSELKALAVDPVRQGEGVGTQLVEAVTDAARRGGVRILEVSTATADIGNLRFYQRAGFRMRSIRRDAFTPTTGYPDGLYVDGIAIRDQVLFDREL